MKLRRLKKRIEKAQKRSAKARQRFRDTEGKLGDARSNYNAEYDRVRPSLPCYDFRVKFMDQYTGENP